MILKIFGLKTPRRRRYGCLFMRKGYKILIVFLTFSQSFHDILETVLKYIEEGGAVFF